MSVDLFNAVLLGIVEGVTEFLPISSTGHLIIAERWFRLPARLAETFEIFIQLGAILAIVWLYRQRLLDLVRRLPRDRTAQTLALSIMMAFLPAAALGFLGRSLIKERLFNPLTVAVALILGGIAIWLLDRGQVDGRIKGLEAVRPLAGLLVGVAQALALVPGVSRSAASILGGLAVGMDRRTAVEFSFFLSIPTMISATGYELVKSAPTLTGSDWLLLAVGFVTAFITAVLVVQFFLQYISRHNFRLFAYYRIVFGLLVLALYYSGLL